ncbi:hypothetical protein QWZ13_06450 [Reinekea marina]|uniref:hypothetical protein n=1 Tax=Reinekea marina TaxID=1310421 RepID=UPI0025B2E680|nr:hypothetical protein [Reinekea marina]MDN3648549.1 hypothetical protein [Reinekea marina]
MPHFVGSIHSYVSQLQSLRQLFMIGQRALAALPYAALLGLVPTPYQIWRPCDRHRP